MQAHDERLQGGRADVVELVDGHQDAGGVVGRHLAQLDEQPGQVGGQVPRVGRPVHGVDVDAHLRPSGQAQAEGLQDAERAAYPFADAPAGVHGQQHPPERRGQPYRQVPVLVDLDVLVEVAPALGQLFELVEQHRLAHAPQPGEHLAAPVPAQQQALEGDVHGLDLPLPAHQRRRACPRPRAVGVAHGVHQVSI